ncbi:hypothetical protein [Desulforamulus putei]|uniref:Uncharacterized protein n=1 Tax=Desulforamulus putei DSM 12395 TaxID=1121429 RepID=A0A1M4ZT66_9FIRM|nr:hypothetical protein [Desulforamulus putei]SHF21017.1 hypothetical protein SAMN02745133_02090 [Desulforamulus putei DSM 12395]
MIQVNNFKEVVNIRKSCGEKDAASCQNSACPLQARGTLGITVCELVTSHINTKPDCVEIVCNCPVEDDPLGIKDFFEHCEKGYIRPTSRQLEFMKRQQEKCRNCPANTRYTMHHPKLNIEISPHLCTTLKSTAQTIRNAARGNSCCLISPRLPKKLPKALSMGK